MYEQSIETRPVDGVELAERTTNWFQNHPGLGRVAASVAAIVGPGALIMEAQPAQPASAAAIAAEASPTVTAASYSTSSNCASFEAVTNDNNQETHTSYTPNPTTGSYSGESVSIAAGKVLSFTY